MVLPVPAPAPEDARGAGGPEDLASLGALLRLGQGRFTLAFACYDRSSQRGRLIERLRAELPGWNLAAVSLQDPRLDSRERSGAFFGALASLAHQSAAGRTPEGVLLLDWEKLLLPAPAVGETSFGSLAGLFNRGRHVLQAQLVCPVVVWLPREAMASLEIRAPDFVSWRSGAFDYPFSSAEVEAGLRALLDAEIPAKRERAVAAVEQLETALADWQEIGAGDLSGDLFPRTLSRLGKLYLEAGDPGRAAACFEQLSGWTKEHGAGAWSKQAREGRRRARRKAAGAEPAGMKIDPWQVFRGAATLREQIYGREPELEALLARILALSFRCGTLWGETGCGKTSLLTAGLRPVLVRLGHFPVVVDRYDEGEVGLCRQVAEAAGLPAPADSLAATLAAAADHLDLTPRRRKVVLLLDQFERVFDRASFPQRRRREGFFESLAACVNDLALPCACLLSIRADRLYHLFELDPHLSLNRPLAPENLIHLGWLGQRQALRVLGSLRQEAAAPWAPELLERVIDDLARDGQVRPVELQLVAAALYLRDVNTVAGYERAGAKEGLLQDYLNAVLDECPHPGLARRVLRVLADPGNPPVRRTLPLEEIAREAREKEPTVLTVLEFLEQRHVVQTAGEAWELVHDVLTEPALRAGSPQELGLGLLRSALLRRRRWLPPRQLWRVVKSDRDELPESLRKPARKLIARSWLLLGAILLATGLLVLTGLQFSTAHIRIESDPPRPLVVYRGLRSLNFLPPPLGRTPLYDTGILAEELEVGRHGEVLDMTWWSWEGASGEDLVRLHRALEFPAGGSRLSFTGHWTEGVKRLLRNPEEIHDSRRSSQNVYFSRLAAASPAEFLMALRSASEDPNPEIRVAAIQALGRLPSAMVAPLVPEMMSVAAESEPQVLAAALSSLPGSEAYAKEFLPLLLAWLQSSDHRLQRSAAALLVRFDHGETLLREALRLLDTGEPVAQRAALTALDSANLPAGQAPLLIPRLISLMEEKRSGSRWMAAQVLLRKTSGPQIEPWADRLSALLLDSDDRIKAAAVIALASINARNAELMMPQLVAAIRSNVVIGRGATAEEIVEIGLAYPEVVVPPLVSLLIDESLFSHNYLERLFVQLGREEPQVVALLRGSLTSASIQTRAKIISILGQISPELSREMIAFLDDPAPEARTAAARAIERLVLEKDEEAIDRLIVLLQDPEAFVRITAAISLRLTPRERSAQVVEHLLPLLQDEDPVFETVLNMLGRVGGGNAAAIAPQLLPHLDRRLVYGPYDQVELIADLAQHELLPESLVEVLQQRIKNPESAPETSLRGMGAHWLHEARSQTDEAVFEALLGRLKGDDSRLNGRYREAAVYSLAYWYIAGRLAGEETDRTCPWLARRAAGEHVDFVREIERLRRLERPWWLRVAAWEVVLTAEGLCRPEQDVAQVSF